MATDEEIIRDVRRMADEPTAETYSDEAILALYAQEGSAEGAAAAIWETKAGAYAKLVNVSESGSSRSMSDLHKNALTMAKYYGDQAIVPVETVTSPFTTAIERA